MDPEIQTKRQVNPRKSANIFSIVTFFYNFKLLNQGKKRDIEEKDIYKVLPDFEAKKLGDKLESKWLYDRRRNKNASFLLCLTKCFGWVYLWYGIVQLAFGTAMILLQPMVFSKLVAYFQDGTSLTKIDAYCYATAVVGLDLLNRIYNQNFSQLVAEYSMKVRTAVCSLIFRKALTISPTSFSEVTIGKIITFLSKDIYSIDGALMFLKDMIIGYLQIAVVTYLLYRRIVGLSAFSAIAVILSIILIQIIGGVWIKKNRLKTVQKSDRRYKILQETLSAIKIVKMYVWQNYFEGVIHAARIQEIQKLKVVYFLKALIIGLGGSAISLAFYTLFVTYIEAGWKIDAETVYYSLQCLSALQSAASTSIPFGITQTADTLASLQRIQAFLISEDLEEKNEKREIKYPKVYLSNVTITLKNQEVIKIPSFNLKKGLMLITGGIGSGKSVLLKAILEEYPITDGQMEVDGSVSYAPEEPWLFPSTIRQNIIFGQPYDNNRYLEVLKVCDLIYDINKFEKQDYMNVGDNGINLSKGQRARISLARALYKDSNIYLLDGCLNSLDNHVSNKIFNNGIRGFLKDKICIMVTNNTNHIKAVNEKNVLLLETGYNSFVEQKTDLIIEPNTIEEPASNGKDKLLNILSEKPENLNSLADINADEELPINLYHERNKEGKVLWKTYFKYYRFLGGIYVCLCLLGIFAAAQFCTSYADKLISQWVNLEPKITEMINRNETNTVEYKDAIQTRNEYLKMYSILTAAGLTLFLLKGCSTFYFCLKAAIRLHDALIKALLHCYMYFFDDHFIGNIINRSSKDFYTIDEYMPFLVFDCSRSFFSSVGTVVLLASVSWEFIVLSLLLFIILFFLLRFYLPTGRSLRRLESATRSPVIGYLNSTLEGIPVIRATKQRDIVQLEFDRHQDLYTSAYYMNQTTTRLFSFLVDILGNIFVMGITFKFVVFPSGSNAGDVGLSISQAMSLSQILQWVFKQIAEVETVMTSVERVSEYADAPIETSAGKSLINYWPSLGNITYNNVSLHYKNDNNDVLKDISFDVAGNNKIGIVGRTGAGKSSLISTLFRLYNFEGQIKVDDEDICELPIDHLRSSISIIPQDPILFSGTIRTNIDPLEKYSDEDIWNAIEMVHLRPLIYELNQLVEYSSSNFSAGQKQLICLARAIIQRNKIIVLDEATANLDSETDKLLQETLHNCFENCTVLTIAHRLSSIRHCDKVLVLDAGKIVEFDEPEVLLGNQTGYLCHLFKEDGYLNNK